MNDKESITARKNKSTLLLQKFCYIRLSYNEVLLLSTIHNALPIAGLPTLPDSAEDFLIFRENQPIRVHKFDNLPDSGNFLCIKLYGI